MHQEVNSSPSQETSISIESQPTTTIYSSVKKGNGNNDLSEEINTSDVENRKDDTPKTKKEHHLKQK